MIKGVFFDLGGTLFSYSGMGRATGPLLMDALARMGAGEDTRATARAYRQASNEISRRYADLDYYLHSDLFRDTFLRCAELLELSFDEAIYGAFREQQRQKVVDALELKHDCLRTLETLRGKGQYLSIVSNIDDDMLEPLVEREGLHGYLDHWTSSEAARSCKPHSRFFEVSLDKSGLAADEVLFVGDSPEHDVAGAAGVGMRTALIVEPGVEPPLQAGRPTVPADHTIENLAELVALV